MSSSAAEMIKRFREERPTSRNERTKLSAPKEMWWIENVDSDGRLTDKFEEPRLMSPMKPTKKTESNYGDFAKHKKFLRESKVDDLITGDIESMNISEIGRSKAPRPLNSLISSYDIFISHDQPSSRMELTADLVGVRNSTSLRHSRQPKKDTLSTIAEIGRHGLLVPHLKLDGGEDENEKTGHLSDVNSGLENLMKTLEEQQCDEVPSTLAGVHAQLQSHMMSFTAAFNDKYAREEAEAAERLLRDEKMKEEGRMEERAKAVADFHYFKTISSNVPDSDIFKEYPDEDAKPETTTCSTNTVNHCSRNVPPKRNIEHVDLKPAEMWKDRSYRDVNDDTLLYNRYSRTRRLDALYALHMLDPPAAWLRRPTNTGISNPQIPIPDCTAPDDDREESWGFEVHHGTISQAVEQIEMSLNVALASLQLRLPGLNITSENVVPPEQKPATVSKDDFVQNESTSPPAGVVTTEMNSLSPHTDDAVAHSESHSILMSVSEHDLEMLDKILGVEESSATLKKHCIAKTLLGDNHREIHFHKISDVEAAMWHSQARRGMSWAYSNPQLPAQLLEPSAPKTRHVFNMMTTTTKLHESERNEHVSGLKQHLQHDSYFARERFLLDMKRCRAQFDIF